MIFLEDESVGENMDTVYEDRYVAFLDVLGFKELVRQSMDNQEILNKIDSALNYSRRLQIENYEGTWVMSDYGKQVSVFSDSIVISYEMQRSGAAFHILMDLIHLCNDLLGVGMLVRGGVTVGKLIHENNKCFGPAMVEAYGMESDRAIYPRIVVNPLLIERGLEYRSNTWEDEKNYLNGCIDMDFDGNMYLDYLVQWNEFDDEEIYNLYLCRVRQWIIESLQKFRAFPEILMKYEWLRRYYNKTIQKFGSRYIYLLI